MDPKHVSIGEAINFINQTQEAATFFGNKPPDSSEKKEKRNGYVLDWPTWNALTQQFRENAAPVLPDGHLRMNIWVGEKAQATFDSLWQMVCD